jgi:hypothetical protein
MIKLCCWGIALCNAWGITTALVELGLAGYKSALRRRSPAQERQQAIARFH